ncbi:hypothetical protein [Chryseobacterium potabilaquae]|uniref:Uncharacterized protein n=1 Tax=Chryseobacterium potabilaquae TaxID=2675057 RepID=A0A6N4X809_9FLAO|nr:hypothetical protein [Chryseobacterium potabilaquae]CAA7194359.1 hypothetical protein CHRY9293_00691 [Chryseobacterium potabilaquae]
MLKYLNKIQPIYYILGVFLLCLTLTFLGNDRFPFKYAKDFDEKSYLEIIRYLPDLFHHKSFDSYYISRLLVPGIAHYIIRFLQLDYSNETIQNIFLGLNFLSILLGCYYYFKIIKIKNYSSNLIAIGFCFLFVNFFVMKFSSFYSILMDMFGFTSGIILYYYYLTKKKILFYSLLLICMFIFPTTILIVLGVMLSDIITFDEKGLNINKNFNKWLWSILSFALLFLVSICYIRYDFITTKANADFANQMSQNFIPLTILTFIIFLYFAVKQLLQIANNVSVRYKGFISPTFYSSIGILLFYLSVSKYLSVNFQGTKAFSSTSFIANLLYQILSFPLKFMITHFIYYGLFVVFILFFHKVLFLYAKNNLDSFQKIIFTLFIIFSILGTETRQFLQLFPFVLFIFLDSLKNYKFSANLVLGIFIFQLIWSRFWYIIDLPEGFLFYALKDKDISDFPAQRYFQFQGPWLSETNSIWYGAIFIIIYLITYTILKKSQQTNID